MNTKKILSLLAFGLLIFLFPFTNAGCHLDDFADRPNFAAKRLLHGVEVNTSGNFVYYSIDGRNDGYAVGLSEVGKSQTSIDLNDANPYNGKNVIAIWHDAFFKSNATSVTISTTIQIIDCEAFLGSKITSITIPDNVTTIGEGAFYGCRNLTRAQFGSAGGEGGADECECDTSGGASTPQVTKIPAFCFFDCQSLTDLLLPYTLKEIGEEAFNGCKSISTNIYLQSITTIRSRAFQSCLNLKNISIASTMFQTVSGTGIEERAFLYCSSSLHFTFFGDSGVIGDSETEGTWIYNHPHWGVYSDSGSSYSPDIVSGSSVSTALWNFTVDANNEVTLTKYKGATPTAFISMPSTLALAPANNKVTRIAPDVFDAAIKTALHRLYLPHTLKEIDNNMFDSSYTNLTVISSNKKCDSDKKELKSPEDTYFDDHGKIDLSDLKDLAFIGDQAFVNMNKRDNVEYVHLPSRLIAVGSYVFSVSGGNRFKYVKEFKWDYVDPDLEPSDGSRLEVVGKQSFLLLGEDKGEANDKFSSDARYDSNRKLTTLVFPRCFKHFGLTPADKARYTSEYGFNFALDLSKDANKRPDLVFAGCPLIEKVIFKGSSDSSKTSDLVLTAQTFNCNHNLHTIIFEERNTKTITFHTQKDADWAGSQTIGAAGTNNCQEVDFRSTPMLQTIILPCVNTNIRLQEYAFGGNARAALYLSGSFDTHFKANKQQLKVVDQIDSGFTDEDSFNLTHWDKIGSEVSNGKKRGYDFVTNGGDYNGKNTFNIDQALCRYPGIHYKETIKDAKKNDVTVEVGSGNGKELILDSSSKCSFVCDSSTGMATMSNYLYDCHKGNSETATVPDSITVTSGPNAGKYDVDKIGENAFSACYCDNKDHGLTEVSDLTNVILPDSITEIGKYAFARAYNVKNISASPENKYIMPSGLTTIGKHAFIFSGIEQVRKIPYECIFFENTDESTKTTTNVFSNCLSLRYISFLSSSDIEGNESRFYKTTTYKSTTDRTPTYTTALYAKNLTVDGVFTNYTNRLLLLLNRFVADKDAGSLDYALQGNDSYRTFDCAYKANGATPGKNLYGAMKMGYWIRKVNLNSSYIANPEPLFTAICNRTRNGSGVSSEATKKEIYLGKPVYAANIDAIACDLEEIAGNVFNAPTYAFAGCEKLHIVELPNNSGKALPEGIFANVTNTDIKYKTNNTPEGRENNNILDLTGTGYSAIGNETFRNNQAIQKFIAPNRENFTVNANAFRDCDNLRSISFKNVTGTLTLKEDCFAYCDNLEEIIWPDNCTSIVFDKGAFRYCGTNTEVGKGTATLKFPSVASLTISQDCFRDSPFIEKLDFSNVTETVSLLDRCFANCDSLDQLTWPGSGTEVDLEHEGMFAHCDDLVNAALPQNVKANASGHHCVGTITDGTNINSADYRAVFQMCFNLEKVYVEQDQNDNPNNTTSNITDFMAYSFRQDRSLTDFVFEDFPDLRGLHRDMFGGGYSAQEWSGGYAGIQGAELVLPESLTTLGKSCFAGCGAVSIEFLSTSLDTNDNNSYGNGGAKNENHFMNSRALTTVKFNKDCQFGSNFYKSDHMFDGCSELETILLPQNFYEKAPTMTNFIMNAPKVNLLIQGKYKALDAGERTNLNNDTGNWRKSDANTIKPINWQIDSDKDIALADVLNDGGTDIYDDVTNYWAYINGNPVVLGTTVSYESGTVTFSSGYKLSSTSGFVAP